MSVMEPRIEDGVALRVAGLSGRYDGKTRYEIPALWGRFIQLMQAGKLSRKTDGRTYGVCYNFDFQGNFDYLCGVEVEANAALSPELAEVTIPASRVAVYRHDGPIGGITQTWDEIMASLPGSGFRLLEAPSYERYSADFEPEPPAGFVEICFPVEAATIS